MHNNVLVWSIVAKRDNLFKERAYKADYELANNLPGKNLREIVITCRVTHRSKSERSDLFIDNKQWYNDLEKQRYYREKVLTDCKIGAYVSVILPGLGTNYWFFNDSISKVIGMEISNPAVFNPLSILLTKSAHNKIVKLASQFLSKESNEGTRLNGRVLLIIGVSITFYVIFVIYLVSTAKRRQEKELKELKELGHYLKEYLRLMDKQNEDKQDLQLALDKYLEDLEARGEELQKGVGKLEKAPFTAVKKPINQRNEHQLFDEDLLWSQLLNSYPQLPDKPTAAEVQQTIKASIEHHNRFKIAAETFLKRKYGEGRLDTPLPQPIEAKN